MKAGLIGVQRCMLGSYSRAFSVTSSHLASARPRSIIEWQRELSLPSPSSQNLLSKLHLAMQAPFPPLQQPHAWIESYDVEESLKIVLSSEGSVGRVERKEMLDTIVMCLQRCLHDAKKRVTIQVERECALKGCELTESEKETRIHRHPSVRGWQGLLASNWLLHHRLKLGIKMLRKPPPEQFQEGASMTMRSSVAGLGEFNQLLHLINRQMPQPDEGGNKRRFLELNTLFRELQLNIQDLEDGPSNCNGEHKGQSLSELLRVLGERKRNSFPQDLLHQYKVVWACLCEHHKPDFISYGTALLLETQLASWRAIVPGGENCFEPVHKVMQKIQEKGLLHTSHLNQLMWAVLRYDPNLQNSSGEWQSVIWPSVDDCLQLYQEMRGNAVLVEMAWEQKQSERENGEKGTGLLHLLQRRSSAKTSVLGLSHALPLEAIPSQQTYELLLRGLAWRGELKKAVTILHEMTQSNHGTKERLKKLQRSKVDSKKDEKPSPTYTATFATFDSFFRGFCKHSVPSSLIYFDPNEPGKSQWQAMNANSMATDWNIEALMSLLEVFLELDPQSCRIAMEGYPTMESTVPTKANQPVDNENWYLEPHDSMLQLWSSILSFKDPVADHQRTVRGPSTQQLFTLLTALRRTSNDEARWVLSQWQRVVDKFGKREGSTHNEEGWKDWKLDNRLRRVVEHLQGML